MPNFGVLLFPGSNCDHDCYHAIRKILGQPCDMVWHEETSLEGIDCVVIPGGFSYGDYLRAGAISQFLSPVVSPLRELAGLGVPVIGICNGFQILVESGLLPGAFIHNSSLKFVCRWTNVRIEDTDTPFTCLLSEGDVLRASGSERPRQLRAAPGRKRHPGTENSFAVLRERGRAYR